ncbi:MULTISPECIES: hypothetical protein [Alteribacillus]|uniref:Uncharacterized protein n=1 Tax=Alteribacillus bidgolensis TaxID=930129 RepID=A0A1G8QB14_9BACI|nr:MULTISPECIES: hypothetical protein [Alteribacillus]SDJ01917.1 hypothetical protein SAMN05216352_1194 [Alteribacillus bidgolensis]
MKPNRVREIYRRHKAASIGTPIGNKKSAKPKKRKGCGCGGK